MPHLGVNIDHVATLRQARYRAGPGGSDTDYGEPDPVRAAHEAELGGADCITVHLREDRRHIIDRDLDLICRTSRVKVNLEMAATDEMIRLACRLREQELPAGPHMATLVPEGRQEVTTEGGLHVAGQAARMKDVVSRLRGAGLTTSAFIDPDLPQVAASRAAGFECCEVHTGPYAQAFARCGGEITREDLLAELERVALAGGEIRGSGMRFHAGHGLNYVNVGRIAGLEGVAELHIGHSIVSRAIYVGMRRAVREMKDAIAGGVGGRAGAGASGT